MKELQVNLHTHTVRCKHAVGSVKEYCQEAVKAGMKILGISEHSAFPDDRHGSTRMAYKELEEYRQEIEDAKSLFPTLTILAGLEVDVHPDFPLEFYQKELKERLDLDYMCAGVHFVHDKDSKCIFASATERYSIDIIRLFAEKTVRLIECGMFDFITHPDMIGAFSDRWDAGVEQALRSIAEASKKYDVPLEINAYGLRKPTYVYADSTRHPYPWEPFWEMAAGYQVSCVIGSDAHEPADVYGNLPEAFAIAEKFNIPVCNVRTAEKIIAAKK